MVSPVLLDPSAEGHPQTGNLLRCGAAQRAADTSRPALIICADANGLQLRDAGALRESPWIVDFDSDTHRYRRRRGGGLRQALVRAAGINAAHRPRIVDATAGWARDAFVFATAGCDVTMLERNPVVAALLEDGLRRGLASGPVAEIVARMRLHAVDAITWLADPESDRREVVYLDPMYPATGKTAQVKKEARLLRQLIAETTDETALLSAARLHATSRVVVKRPKQAMPLGKVAPDTVISGRTTRYDLYLC